MTFFILSFAVVLPGIWFAPAWSSQAPTGIELVGEPEVRDQKSVSPIKP